MEGVPLPGVRENLRNTLRRIGVLIEHPLAGPDFLATALTKLRQWYVELVELAEAGNSAPLAGGVGFSHLAPATNESERGEKSPVGSGTPASGSNPSKAPAKERKERKPSQKRKEKKKKDKEKKKEHKAKEKGAKKADKSEESSRRLRSQTPLVTPAAEREREVLVKEEPEESEEVSRSPSQDPDLVLPRVPTPEPRRRRSPRSPASGRKAKDKSPAQESGSKKRSRSAASRTRRRKSSRSSPRTPRRGRSTPGERSRPSSGGHRHRAEEVRSRSPRLRERTRSVTRDPRSRSPAGSRKPVEPSGPPPGYFREPVGYPYQWWHRGPHQPERTWGKNRGRKTRERNADIQRYGCNQARKEERIAKKEEERSK